MQRVQGHTTPSVIGDNTGTRMAHMDAPPPPQPNG